MRVTFGAQNGDTVGEVKLSEFKQKNGHSRDAIERFYVENRAVIDSSELIIRLTDRDLADDDRSSSEEFTLFDGCTKEVFSLGQHRYIFLNAHEKRQLRNLGTEFLQHFLEKYGITGCLSNITHQTSVLIEPYTMTSDDEAASSPTKRKRVDNGGLIVAQKRVRTETVEEMAIVPSYVSDLHRSNSDLRVQLALRERELSEIEARVQTERDLVSAKHIIELQERELFFYRQLCVIANGPSYFHPPTSLQQQQQQQLSGVGRIGGITTIPEWLSGSLYSQDFSLLSVPQPWPLVDKLGNGAGGGTPQHRFPHWAGLFVNPAFEVKPTKNDRHPLHLLHSQLKVSNENDARYRVRLSVPLTYRYSLKYVLQLIAEKCCRTKQFASVIGACPAEYQVVLFSTSFLTVSSEQPCGGDPNDPQHLARLCERVERNARLNAATLVTHCHFFCVTQELERSTDNDKRDWVPLLQTKPASPLTTPSIELMEEFFPHAAQFGLFTSLTHNMTLSATMVWDVPGKQGKGMRTGKNKKCPFCRSCDPTLLPAKTMRISHNVKNCSALAMLSDNEAEILVTLREACIQDSKLRSNEKRLTQQLFIFGEPKKKSVPRKVLFDGHQLLRHATPEELALGEHIHGLRLNREIYAEMRKNVYASLRFQFEGRLFDTLNEHAADLARLLHDLPSEVKTVASLIRGADGEHFLDSHFETRESRTPLREFGVDRLFFSLDSRTRYLPRTTAYLHFFQMEQFYQQYHLSAAGGGVV
jgi:hypothetical protein